ncbi:MAG: hypothetical protein ACXAD7_07835 [Candidatus Kariarchaeaceae archaeon]|jgi:hypothetical protein
MALDTTLSWLNFGVNTGFMIISVLIIYSFLSRFQGDIPYRQTNILGFILMALGLSFHILGHLIIELISEESFFDDASHFLRAFIALAVVMFVLGSALIAYYNSSDENKTYFKIFAWIFLIVGSINVFYHIYVFTRRNESFEVFGQDPADADLAFLIFEMISLSIIYFVIFLNARKSIRLVVSARYKLLAYTSLGFVIVILVDALLALEIIKAGELPVFLILFILHVITVGALYLLVIFPQRYQNFIGITPSPS